MCYIFIIYYILIYIIKHIYMCVYIYKLRPKMPLSCHNTNIIQVAAGTILTPDSP